MYFIMQFKSPLLQQELQKTEGKKGYWEKLMVKVIDNIQVTIKYCFFCFKLCLLIFRNIHIRFEDNVFGKKPYSFGFTLDELFIHTTNEFWKKDFIDRTREKNKDLPLYKIMKIKRAAFYWISGENNIIGLLSEEAEIEAELIKAAKRIKESKYILIPSIQFSYLFNSLLCSYPYNESD